MDSKGKQQKTVANSGSDLLDAESLGTDKVSAGPGEESRRSKSFESHGEVKADSSAVRADNIQQPALPPPDGGLWAWLQVVGSFIWWFNSW